MPDTPWVLGGTKMDLLDDQATIKKLSEKSQTPISFQEATELANELGARAFVPYSSLTQKVRLLPPAPFCLPFGFVNMMFFTFFRT